MLVAGSGSPVGAEPVDSLGEEQAEQSEEESRDFEPEDAAGMNKGSPDGLAEPFGSSFCSFDRIFAASSVGRSILPDGLCCLRGAVAQHS